MVYIPSTDNATVDIIPKNIPNTDCDDDMKATMNCRFNTTSNTTYTVVLSATNLIGTESSNVTFDCKLLKVNLRITMTAITCTLHSITIWSPYFAAFNLCYFFTKVCYVALFVLVYNCNSIFTDSCLCNSRQRPFFLVKIPALTHHHPAFMYPVARQWICHRQWPLRSLASQLHKIVSAKQ